MLKLRIQGIPEEVKAFCDALEDTGCVLERSDQYANRGKSQYVRVYMDVDVPNAHRRLISDSKPF